jgi:hypothetical protein
MFIELIIILLLLTAVIVILLISYAHKGGNNVKISNPVSRDEFDSGDLLFVRYDNPLGYFMRLVSGSIWTHVAMVYRDPEHKLYILETANYPGPAYKGSKTKHKGVLFMPIEEWFQLNKKRDIAVMKFNTPRDFDRDSILYEFSKVSDRKLDTISINWSRLLLSKKYEEYKNLQENITCYELIVHILQQINAVEKEYAPLSYFPKNIINGDLPFKKGFEYSKLRQIK